MRIVGQANRRCLQSGVPSHIISSFAIGAVAAAGTTPLVRAHRRQVGRRGKKDRGFVRAADMR
jgi:hypothetical protein